MLNKNCLVINVILGLMMLSDKIIFDGVKLLIVVLAKLTIHENCCKPFHDAFKVSALFRRNV